MVRDGVLWLVHFWNFQKPGQMNIGIEYFPFFLFFFTWVSSVSPCRGLNGGWMSVSVQLQASVHRKGRWKKKRNQTETREDDDCDNMWWKRGIGEKFATDQDPGLIRQLSRVIREMFPELHTPIGSSSLSSSGIQNSPWDINRSCTSVLVPKQLKRSILTVSRN